MEGSVGFGGTLRIKKIGATKAPLSWRFRNASRWVYIWGWLCYHMAYYFSKFTKIPTITGCLTLRKRLRDGSWIDYGIVGYRLVTNAGVNFLVDDWDGGVTEMSNMHFHGVGTTNTAENVADTALAAESTTALNPDSTRATGTQSQPSANILRSIGTLTFDASAAIVEHGLFSAAATGTGTVWDRTVFLVVNMASGESLQCQYDGTVNSGG